MRLFSQILTSIQASLSAIKGEAPAEITSHLLIDEKASLMKKSLENIDLGLGEAQVCCFTHSGFLFLVCTFISDTSVVPKLPPLQ